ncbi:MAG: deoxyribodipyrimidine photo-lyase [Acidimicrobiaceae bacterium]|nr:deoxyribodipyrimidine photo-lyase [Acidimicrobiaceae bacterium]MCY4176422.1 deoxyribodipyrimidine photo-lyase [Acidimicrobiaceae bacterium]MCY4280740.1 deoxyribodipyrimidine photo-lyase [Acidimicrobiaceae bacterium]MCY4295208.1 deoxyribodipyrimidine photo-lyase [Acidimicrobiaceae bacterium]
MRSVNLAWFRRDLRLLDNPAWADAASGGEAAALVVLQPALLQAAGPWRLQAYLGALAGLDRSLRDSGAGLWVEVGDPARVVQRVMARIGARRVTVNADVTRCSVSRDRRVAEAIGSPLAAHWGTLVHPPGSVLTSAGRLSRVFTPFYKTWARLPLPDASEPGTARLIAPPAESTLAGALAASGLQASRPWSEHDALERLESWGRRVDDYLENRDSPAAAGTSELSAALRFGLLSPRHLAVAVGAATPGRSGFVRQLAWRDWYAHLTAEHPEIDRVSLRSEYDRIAWRSGSAADTEFAAWRDGRTGYPIVDAAMRQLASCGWMHNRLRMVAASFLVKDLLVDWRRGERWFRRMLIDGEIAQNCGNWQWVAGTGPDAAPYFRVFNPVTQSRRFDPDGRYLRLWLPELAALHSRDIHAPWQAKPLDLAAAGVVLGSTYPAPIVDHAEARLRTIAAYRQALS